MNSYRIGWGVGFRFCSHTQQTIITRKHRVFFGKYRTFKSLHWDHNGTEVFKYFSCSMLWDNAHTKCLQTHLVGIGSGRRNISWSKSRDSAFLVFHWTRIRQKRNNPYLEKSMGINVRDSYHMIVGFCWSYP